MTKLEGLTDAEIDSMYVEMRQIAAALLNNTEDNNYYENAFASINEIGKTLNSQMDSRVILDRNGAETLLGRGDMLLMMSGAELERIQGAMICDEDIEKVMEYLGSGIKG